MFARVYSAAIAGVLARMVSVEADVSTGLPGFVMVGYVSSQVREAHERVRAALRHANISMPARRITINLSPGDMKKEGTGFDLPVAAAILAAMGEVPTKMLDSALMAGELSLDGSVLGVTGILPRVLAAKEEGLKRCILPCENLDEASMCSGIEIIGVSTIEEFIDVLDGAAPGIRPRRKKAIKDIKYTEDFADIRGQAFAKRAALIAASGFHNMLMIGPPGTGKSMIAKRIPTILPDLSRDEELEIARIMSVAGIYKEGVIKRPFRSPHHTVSGSALAGGGRIPVPGEITLSHRGVLFLDEMPEFQRNALEILRQPMEDKKIIISRAEAKYEYPADFLLVAAMNPCPCGNYPDMTKCTCSHKDVNRYLHKISRPLLDRIDLCVKVSLISFDMLSDSAKDPMSSAKMRDEVRRVFEIQKKRFAGRGIHFNGEMSTSDIEKFCVMEDAASLFLKEAFAKFGMSARSYHRILKVARTIADLSGEDVISEKSVKSAVFFRVSGEMEV